MAANFTAFLLKDIFRYRRNVIITNLNLVYGSHWPKPRQNFLKEIYRQFVYLWFELLQSSRFDFAHLKQSIVLHNVNVLDDALAQGKGVVLLAAHLGNYECIGDWLAGKGYPIAAVAKRQKNPWVDAYILKLRKRFGTQIIYSDQAMKKGLGLLRKGWIVGLVADQYAGDNGVEIPFMGLLTKAFRGPAALHLRIGAPMIYAFGIRRSYARFDLYFEAVPNPDSSELSDKNIGESTRCHSDVLEKRLRAHPEQWFWSHKRWKNLTNYKGMDQKHGRDEER